MATEILVPLTLGSFTFDDYWMENPEQMGDLGGTQSIQQRDFPGGIRTQRTYGYFPAAIRWRARFSGGLASDRVEQVKRILTAGAEIVLSWGERSWSGLLARFSPSARHTWLFDYDLEYWPRIDLSNGQGESDGEPSPEEVMGLQELALNSWLSGGGTFYPYVSPQLTAPINAVLTAVDVALAASQGVVALISALHQLTIQTAVNALIGAALPLTLELDPLISSPAWDIYSRGLVIQNLIRTTEAPRWVVPSINPNLMALSAQYYGDAALWRTIASANGLSDPQPLGDFQIQIPPP